MIRKATNKDLPRVVELVGEGLDELGQKYHESLLLKKVVNSFHLAPCFLLEIGGIVRGIAGFTVIKSSWDGEATLSDYLFYIEEEYRNLKNLDGLVEEAKGFADSVDLPLRIEHMVERDSKLHKRLISHFGFKLKFMVAFYND